MHSHVRPFWIALLALGGVYANAAGQDAQTTAHMVYTEEQATRGEDVFWNICSECHFEEDFAGPFMQSWSGAMVKDLMDEIKATMPEDNPGGLEDSHNSAWMFVHCGAVSEIVQTANAIFCGNA